MNIAACRSSLVRPIRMCAMQGLLSNALARYNRCHFTHTTRIYAPRLYVLCRSKLSNYYLLVLSASGHREHNVTAVFDFTALNGLEKHMAATLFYHVIMIHYSKITGTVTHSNEISL